MADLSSYLEDNGFYACEEDINAILRRCDHDANRLISFSEFCELTAITDPGQEPPEELLSDFNDRVTDFDRTNDLRQSHAASKFQQNQSFKR